MNNNHKNLGGTLIGVIATHLKSGGLTSRIRKPHHQTNSPLMQIDSFSHLASKRAAHAKSIRDNNDHSHEIIGEQLYSKPVHFIFELLQNAEDEGATTVNINYDDQKFLLEHNGRPFDINDIEAITSFGNNERKRLKSNAIGRFGIGFKSVFSVTDKPEVHSNPYHFSIINYIVPTLLPASPGNRTTIILPFKKSQRISIYNMVRRALDELDANCLLFLNNIKTIVISDLNKEQVRKVVVKRTKYKTSPFKVLHISQNEEEPEQFFLFEKNFEISNKKLPIKIAFSIARKNNRVVFKPVESSPLFAFFATEVQTLLPFYIHAPFLTTPARDNIMEDEIRNNKLLLALSELMESAIIEFKTQNLIDLRTWLVFPCNMSLLSNKYYKVFAEKFVAYLEKPKTAILPATGGGLCHINDSMRAKEADLKSLLTAKDTNLLFNRTKWIISSIDQKEFSIVSDCIRNKFQVPGIGYKELCERADNTFFKTKPDQWMLRFYSQIAEYPELWRMQFNKIPEGPLRTKAFIRTSKNHTVNPFDADGNLNVYFQADSNSDYQFVKKIFTEDKDSKRFFKSLNLRRPDLLSEVNEHVIPRIENANLPYKGYKDDLSKIFKAIKKSDFSEERLLISKLQRVRWMPGRDNLTKTLSLRKPDELYYPAPELKSFFKSTNTVVLLDLAILRESNTRTQDVSLFENLGVFFRPRRFYSTSNGLIFESRTVSGDWNTSNIQLEGLAPNLKKSLDQKSSIKLWNYLAKNLFSSKSVGYEKTQFVKLLQTTKWLYSRSGTINKPSNIIYAQLPETYNYSAGLKEALVFKPDEISNIETTYKGRFLPEDDFAALMNQIDHQAREIERLKQTYEPQLAAEDEADSLPLMDEILIGDALPDDDIIVSDTPLPVGYQINRSTTENANNQQPVQYNSRPSPRQKRIGLRGEEYILKVLRKKYSADKSIRIVDLNENEKLGAGCDFLVKKNNIIIELIEVKATEGGYENSFKLSHAQFKAALQSHLSKEVPPYYLYCVYWAASNNPQYMVIKDPIEYLMQRKIRADELWFNIRR